MPAPNNDTRMRRFWDRIDMIPHAGCWIWTGGRRTKFGYGRIQIGKKLVLVHRWAYEQFIGKIPSGMHVCHKCDVPECVNPDHLFIGTHLDNMKDRDNKGRNISHAGEKHWAAKLSEEDVLNIRSSSKSHAELGREYGVTTQAIFRARNNLSWSHITPRRDGQKDMRI